MTYSAGCWKAPVAGLAIATIFLSGCAGVDFEGGTGVCPPVVEYSRAEQGRVADEVAALPEGAVIVGWIADYAVLREQVRACAQRGYEHEEG